ncbi:MAG TPA: alpha-ketoacid dehydrogenase subunit beta [Bacteroidetes bacterium]|nr:pyruvate dehydrogenase E1 component subunit beta [bacterium BMS3Bbin04]HDO65451.1 alpha-ketoacid dehydrogenase subunit beta [Bacteroidota bacterium]HEX04576.1 alpha-ketoacid dehydrogenase subunit beta [Bacteroidota bacterium]
MAKMNMIQAINLALHREMEGDDSVLVMGEDVAVNGGVFRATEGLLEKFGDKRVIDTPLAEAGIVGTATGMAIGGLKPVTEMQFSGFSYNMFHQLEGNASRMRARSRGQFTVPLVIRMPFGGGVRALEHHSESKEVYYAHTPGIKVVIPSRPANAFALLRAAIQDPDPVIFMEPKRSYRSFKGDVADNPEPMQIGKAEIVQGGKDITVISWGAMFHDTQQVVEELQADSDISIELLDLLTISPMDAVTIAESVKKTGRCVVVQEAHRSFGPASEIIAHINDRALMYLEAPVKRVTMYDTTVPLFGRELLYLPSKGHIRKAIQETIDF